MIDTVKGQGHPPLPCMSLPRRAFLLSQATTPQLQTLDLLAAILDFVEVQSGIFCSGIIIGFIM